MLWSESQSSSQQTCVIPAQSLANSDFSPGVMCHTAGQEEEEVTFQSPCSAFSSLPILRQNGTEIKRGVTCGAMSAWAECGASQHHRIAQKGTLGQDPTCQKMLLCDGTKEFVAHCKSAIVVVCT